MTTLYDFYFFTFSVYCFTELSKSMFFKKHKYVKSYFKTQILI